MKNKTLLLYGTLSASVIAVLVFAASLLDFSVPVVNRKTIDRCSELISKKQQEVKNIASNIHSLADFEAISTDKISPDLALFIFEDGQLRHWINDIPADEAELLKIDTCLQYQKINHGWYLARKYQRAKFDVVATLLIQTCYPYTNQFLIGEINSALGFSNDISILPTDSPTGSMVYGLEDIPLFKITSADRHSHYKINLLLRWIAVVLALCSIFFFFLYTNSSRLILVFIALLIALRALLFFGNDFFAGELRLFSPKVFADSCYLHSLGSLLLDVIFAFLIVSMLYHWRRVWRVRYARSSSMRKYISSAIAFAVTAITIYLIHYIVRSVSLNSVIGLALQRLQSLDIYSIIAYIIFGFMYTTLFLMIHLSLKTFCQKQYHRWIKRAFFFFFLLLMPAYTLYVIAHYRQQLEQHKTAILACKLISHYEPVITTFSQESGYPELLQRNNCSEVFAWPPAYSFGKYSKEQLSSRIGEYDYPFHFKEQWKGALSPMVDKESFRHFFYHFDDGCTVVITRRNADFFAYTAALSYNLLFFTVFFILLLRITRRRLGIRPKNKLRKRITFTLFSLLIFSVLFVGVSSILHTIVLYRYLTDSKMNDRLQLVLASLDPYLQDVQVDKIYNDKDLAQRVTRIARGLLLDINMYDINGKLIISSRPEIFTKHIQSSRMNTVALTALRHKGTMQFTTNEQLVAKSYLSIYAPYHNQNGEFVAFVNLPNFLDTKNITKDIYTIITAFANLYIVLMIIAIFMGWALSNRLIRPLSILQRHLQGLDILAAPDYIDYTSDDEIGAVVAAYNEMLTVLNKSAKQLAKSERESAWREMAQQIAHEIKNPLTPMRLSLQHLVRLKKDNRPEWKKRFDEVSKTFLEQIDTLTKTASEFSSFAKVNKSTPSIIDLKIILQEQQPLFDSYPNIDYRADFEVVEAPISAHHEQITRVLMNVLTNAVEALEEKEEGIVVATLRESESHYCISIEDNGRGIDAEMEAQLFTPNFTSKKSGNGLGLSICRNILEDYGGSISYSRSSLGGACFTICLPKQPSC
ncbi:MAG: ATP-binding protein [Bacteroidales bacterium]|nr:ATP-binding protein [Bacteroidales bacterium]MCL2133476.1 ATP-binding protein [Bacteroidales bacterium]